jgi:cytochrome b561
MADGDGRTGPEAATRPQGYDGLAIGLHWVTAVLVVALFALAEIWGFVPRGTPLRHGMQSLHVSLGLTLAAVFVLRLVWRSTGARRVAPLVSGVQHIASVAVHYGLYGLLALQIVLGFLFRWAEAPVGFFGLFGIPSPFSIDRATRHQIGYLHDKVAWIIIILAAAHAATALAHRYILRDQVLQRMLPSWSTR